MWLLLEVILYDETDFSDVTLEDFAGALLEWKEVIISKYMLVGACIDF